MDLYDEYVAMLADEERMLAEENERYNAMAHQYDEDMMHFEDNVDIDYPYK